MKRTKNTNEMYWLLAGLGVGAGIGVMFAPKSGRETRRLIQRTATDSADYVQAKVGKGAQYLQDQSAEIALQARNLVSRGKSLVTNQTDQITAAVEAGKQAYHRTAAEG